ncbi:uncharacterized protein LOC135161435 [Diachasmimorpha longicaudata]|uniref:uncharacterized protein LOC135161435 n=1 Tax=Diachasmimorpha longicaudata TaxID=58733 RepID=UPI0030B86D71
MAPSISCRKGLSLMWGYLVFISLWNSGLSLDFGLSLKQDKLSLKNLPIPSILQPDNLNASAHAGKHPVTASDATESAVARDATSSGTGAHVRNLEATNVTDPSGAKAETRFEKKLEINGASSPSMREDATFHPDTVLFRAEELANEEAIPTGEVKGRFDIKTRGKDEPRVEISAIERIDGLPAHNLTANPEAIDPVTRKLFDREDIQPPVNKSTADKVTQI